MRTISNKAPNVPIIEDDTCPKTSTYKQKLDFYITKYKH